MSFHKPQNVPFNDEPIIGVDQTAMSLTALQRIKERIDLTWKNNPAMDPFNTELHIQLYISELDAWRRNTPDAVASSRKFKSRSQIHTSRIDWLIVCLFVCLGGRDGGFERMDGYVLMMRNSINLPAPQIHTSLHIRLGATFLCPPLQTLSLPRSAHGPWTSAIPKPSQHSPFPLYHLSQYPALTSPK